MWTEKLKTEDIVEEFDFYFYTYCKTKNDEYFKFGGGGEDECWSEEITKEEYESNLKEFQRLQDEDIDRADI